MENPSELEENMQVLEAEMLILKDLRYAGDRQLQEWMQDVKGKAGEVENLQQELGKLKTGTDPTNINVRIELTMKVVQVLKDIRLLKQEANAHPESLESLLLELGIEKPKQYSYEDLSSFTSNFSIKVGQGASAQVYKGQLPNGVQVAVKVLVEHDVIKEMFMAEVRTMGRTYHRNLIKLYGFCFDRNNKALVYEYMENGSLDRVLYENHHSIEWEKLYGIATDIAKAIAYLHDGCSEQIIHHDVKPANVLLDSNFSPKVTDFGLAKLLNRDRNHITLTRIRGTPGYLAPEMWMPASLVTYKCDVYSYGMLLFEVLGRRNNSQNNKQWFPTQVWEKFEAGQLDEIIDDCGIRENNRENATVLSMVAFWCAQFTAQVRPTMSTVVKMLEKEISITMPPNPFFPSNFVSSLQHLPEMNHPKVAASISLQPSRLPEVNRPIVTDSVLFQPSHLQEVINPKVAAKSLQQSDMPTVIHPKVAASISVEPSEFLEATRPKVNAFVSLQPSDSSEVIRPKEIASLSLQLSDFREMIEAKLGASTSTRTSHSQKIVQPKAAHSTNGSVILSLGSSSVDADVSTAPFGASGFQNSLYPMDDSSDMFNGAGQVEPPTRNVVVKVYKSGSVGRSLDIGRFSSCHELREELGRMFGVEGQLDDPLRSGWLFVYVDTENDVLLLGDEPWDEFVNNVWGIKIVSPEDNPELWEVFGYEWRSKTKQYL